MTLERTGAAGERRDVARLLGSLGARFEIESRLGAGGSASVFRAFDRARGARVALKVPHDFDARALLGLKDEFRALASISHPNVVAFHELFVTDDAWFFTMQLVRGVDVLTHVLTTRRAVARDVLAGLAAGLDALHAQGIVHRDLKPSNAWVDGQGIPVLLDFGLALSSADREVRTSRAGTPGYFAPELLRGRAPSPASDVYALGVIAFEMLAGRKPFAGPPLETLAKQLAERAPRIREVAPDVDPALAELVDAMLDDGPDLRPSAAEARAILARCATSPISVATPRALIGRDALAEGLADALVLPPRGSLRRTPVVRFVRGPAGIGKSTLVDRALVTARARDPEMLVLRGRCSEHETVPFATLDAIVDQLARRLASDDVLRGELDDPADIARLTEAFPVFASVIDALDVAPPPSVPASDPRERLRQVGDALTAILRQLARERTVVLAIDDLQWADEDGARLLRDVVRGLTGARVALVVAHRDDCASGPLAGLMSLAERSELDVATLSVPPLSVEDADALATTLGAPVEGRERLLRESGGSPFLLETLIAGGLDVLEGALDPEALARSAVARRLATLPASSRALLETVCVAAHAVPADVASRASGSPGDLGSVRALAVARLVRSRPSEAGGAELEAYHDRLREIVSAGIAVERRRAIHAALASALERRSGTDPMWVCVHLEGAGDLERAASYAETGARRASQSLAFARAAELFRFALAHRAHGDDRTRDLQVALGDALANAGRGHDAAQAYLDACAEERDPDRRLDLRRRAAEHQLRSGFFAEGTALLHSVLAETGVRVRATPHSALASLVRNRMWLRRNGFRTPARPQDDPAEIRRIDACFSGAVGLSVVDSIRSADLMTDALRRSLTIGDRRRLAAALGWYAAFLANGGGAVEPATRAVLAEARALNDAHGDPYARGCFEAATALTEFHLGHLSLASAACGRAAAIFSRETVGSTKELSTVHIFELASLALRGRLSELARRTDELVVVSEARGERYALSNYRQGLMILRWLAADDPEGARRDLDAALVDFGVRGFVVQHWFDLWGRVTTDLYEDRPEAARALYTATRGRVLRSLLVRTQFIRGHTMVLDASTAIACIGRAERSAALVAWVRLVIAQLARERRPWTSALARALGACLVAATGDRARGHRELAAAIPELERAELGLYAAAAHAVLASEGLGSAHAAARDAWASREGVRDPARLARALLPGFARAV